MGLPVLAYAQDRGPRFFDVTDLNRGSSRSVPVGYNKDLDGCGSKDFRFFGIDGNVLAFDECVPGLLGSLSISGNLRANKSFPGSSDLENDFDDYGDRFQAPRGNYRGSVISKPIAFKRRIDLCPGDNDYVSFSVSGNFVQVGPDCRVRPLGSLSISGLITADDTDFEAALQALNQLITDPEPSTRAELLEELITVLNDAIDAL